MRYLAPVLIFAIIGIVILLVIRSTNRHGDTRKNLSNTLALNTTYKTTIRKIDQEVTAQLLAGYSDAQPIKLILNDLDKELNK